MTTSQTGLKNRARPRRRGFTLVEVLISLVVLSVGIVLVLRAFGVALFALREARDAALANALISGKIEEMRETAFLSGYNALRSMDGAFSSSEGLSGEARITPIQTSADGSNTLSKVSVRVWRDGARADYAAATFVNAQTSGKANR